MYAMTYVSPCGELVVGADGGKICVCDWKEMADVRLLQTAGSCSAADEEVVRLVVAQLDEYFAGRRRSFTVPLSMAGTEFQKRVWTELLNIGYGSTVSYADVARGVGNPRAVRAVASAIARNRLSVVVPCHRVVGSDGSLTGYRGGLLAKRCLLTLESAATVCR